MKLQLVKGCLVRVSKAWHGGLSCLDLANEVRAGWGVPVNLTWKLNVT